jgi:SlyX protein
MGGIIGRTTDNRHKHKNHHREEIMIEERLTELESRVAFQDDTLQKLNDVIVRQQQDIKYLTAELQLLKQQFQILEPSLIAGQKEETPPPHY